MFQIDSNASVAGMFSEGDPMTGTPGTVVSADWLNAVQQELVNLLTAMGVTLDKANSGQLAAAAVAAATANLLVRRDANGRAQFADPASAQDAATRAFVDARFVVGGHVTAAGAIDAQTGSVTASITHSPGTGIYTVSVPGLTSSAIILLNVQASSVLWQAVVSSPGSGQFAVNVQRIDTFIYGDQPFSFMVIKL